MRFAHQAPELADVTVGHVFGACQYSLVLGHNVQAALIDGLGNLSSMSLQVLDRNIPQSANAGIPLRQKLHALVALFATTVVGAAGVLMLHHRVADHQSQVIGKGNAA